MTLATLQAIVLRLANRGWCRYWVHVNYPETQPWLMGIAVFGADNRPLNQDDLEDEYGMRRDSDWSRNGIYFIERTNNDGSPFRNLL